MSERLVNVDRETPMLFPPDLRDWVADNDLARFVLEAVELVEVGGAINARGTGSAQYPPTMMLAVLIYCYASGIFSSRRIERATYDSVAVRYLCGNHHPDHDTIASFRRQNGALFKRSFARVVQLAREMGMLKLAAVSIDGTRMAGAGSRRSIRTLDQIKAELRALESRGAELLGRAESADRSDRDAGGTQLPPEFADAARRRQKLLEAKARIEAIQQEAEDQGREDGPGGARRADKACLSEPESRTLRPMGGGSVQGYNAQLAVDAAESGLIVGEHLSDQPSDRHLVGLGVESIVPEAGRPDHVLIDKGYENSELIAQVEAAHGLTILCPLAPRANTRPGRVRKGKEARIYQLRQKMRARLEEASSSELYKRRRVSVEPAFARIRKHLGFERLHCWGRLAASAEWTLVCLAHNFRLMAGRMPAARC